jgi:hypothetical protein
MENDYGFISVEETELPDDPNENLIITGTINAPVISVGIASVTDLIVSGISTIGLGTTSSPSNSQLTFELTSNTNLRIKVRGTDGILRFANITLT